MNSPYKMADLGPVRPPRFFQRIYSVWFRHVRVYTRHLISNGFPPFLEPLMFLAGIGLGLGSYVGLIEGKTYIMFLASGIIVPSAMFTATYECTYGSFIRLEFDKVYDGMISASLAVKDMFIGEILFAGTKGFFFSGAVLTVVAGFGLVESGMAVFTPFVGFVTGMMFATLALFVTSFVKNINHFNFFFYRLGHPHVFLFRYCVPAGQPA